MAGEPTRKTVPSFWSTFGIFRADTFCIGSTWVVQLRFLSFSMLACMACPPGVSAFGLAMSVRMNWNLLIGPCLVMATSDGVGTQAPIT